MSYVDRLRDLFTDAGFQVSHRDDVSAEALSWYLDGISTGTLANWRTPRLKHGPRWYKVRGAVRYPLEGILAYKIEMDKNAA